MKRRADPLNYSVREIAVVLNIGLSAAYDAVRDGEIPSVRVGRTYRCPVEMAHRWMGVSSLEKLTAPQGRGFRLRKLAGT